MSSPVAAGERTLSETGGRWDTDRQTDRQAHGGRRKGDGNGGQGNFSALAGVLLLLLVLLILCVLAVHRPDLPGSPPPLTQPMLMSGLSSTRSPLTRCLSTAALQTLLTPQLRSVPVTGRPLPPLYQHDPLSDYTKSNQSRRHDTGGSSAPHANTILSHRQLVEVQPVQNPARTVTVSSYNILSRHYLWESVYSYLPLEYTNWSRRFGRLSRSFEDLAELADILCFQEMEYQVYSEAWKATMEQLGYDAVFQRKPKPAYWTKSANMMDGVAIFFDRNKFDLLNFEQINFADHFKHSSIIDQTADTRARLNVRNTVAVIAVLKHKATGEVLFVSNTHLYWSPKHDDVKLMQTYLLTSLIKKSVMRHYKISLSEVDDMIRDKNGPTVIMAGDFNSSPSSMVYKFMSDGLVDKQQERKFDQNYGTKFSHLISNGLGKFRSPYHDLYKRGLFTKTTYTPKFKGIIDYIWFADCNSKYNFTKVLGDIDSSYLENFKGFPNKEFPSDHIPILAQIEFK